MYIKNISEENNNKISYSVYKDGEVIIEQINNVYDNLVECNKKLKFLEKLKELEDENKFLVNKIKDLILKIDNLQENLEKNFFDESEKLVKINNEIINLCKKTDLLKEQIDFEEIKILLKSNLIKNNIDQNYDNNDIKEFIISSLNEQNKLIDNKIGYIKNLFESIKDNKYIINLFFINLILNILILIKLFN